MHQFALRGRRRSVSFGLQAAIVLAGVLPGGDASAQCRYDVTIIRAPEDFCPVGPPSAARGWALNNSRTVVGRFQCATSDNLPFRWTPEGGFEVLPLPDGVASVAPRGVSDDGRIAGVMGGAISPSRGFVFDNSTYKVLPPDGLFSAALAINDFGMVGGERSASGITNAFLWTPAGGFRDLGKDESEIVSINNDGYAVGRVGLLGAQQAFTWDGDEFCMLENLPGFAYHNASDVNDRRVIAGFAGPALQSADVQAVIWRGGSIESIAPDLPQTAWSAAAAINNSGTVVGRCGLAEWPHVTSFVWQDGVGSDLNRLIESDPPVHVLMARDINELGDIVATGFIIEPFKPVTLLLTPRDRPLGDITGDCRVDVLDLQQLVDDWGSMMRPSDLDGGGVGFSDLTMILADWASVNK